MFADIESVLRAVPRESSSADYVEAIVRNNVTGKRTETTRLKTLRHLRELYGLSSELPIFRAFRRFCDAAPDAAAQLALLVAWSRDPLLRATTQPVLSAAIGSDVRSSALAESVDAAFPHQYSPKNQAKIGRNAASSWTQSGHLCGHARKTRAAFVAKPAAVAFAMFIGLETGLDGVALFSSPWCKVLDLSAADAREKSVEAHRAGLLDFRSVGSVVEIRFPALPI